MRIASIGVEMIESRRQRLCRGLTTFASVVVIAGCSFSFSTAHIGSLKLSKDKAASVSSTTFDPHETVYGHAAVANNISKATIQWRVFAKHVPGVADGKRLPTLDASVDISNDETSTYTLTPPPSGWPPGAYTVEADLIVEDRVNDRKATVFTVR